MVFLGFDLQKNALGIFLKRTIALNSLGFIRACLRNGDSSMDIMDAIITELKQVGKIAKWEFGGGLKSLIMEN